MALAFEDWTTEEAMMESLIDKIKHNKKIRHIPELKEIVTTQTKLVQECDSDEKIEAINNAAELLIDEFYDPFLTHSEALFFPGKPNEKKLVRYLKFADKYCYVCLYTITNNTLSRVLYTLKDRGVDVRVITDDETAHNMGSDVHKLANAGIKVRIDPDPEARMHHKFVVIDDDLLLNGSFNFTSSAVHKNFENIVVIDHPGLIADFKEVNIYPIFYSTI